ncbi:hypothetical protein ACE3MQ_23095 [Paenibacillus lentus]|uniref:hypothetical protein n=1 Tax=Paenibacillus lentus TaxID=1338368 RepID=UPI003651CF0A
MPARPLVRADPDAPDGVAMLDGTPLPDEARVPEAAAPAADRLAEDAWAADTIGASDAAPPAARAGVAVEGSEGSTLSR